MQHIDRIEQLFVHQCILVRARFADEVFPPSRTRAHIKNFWKQAAFGDFSCYDEDFSYFKLFPFFFLIYSSAALGFYFSQEKLAD